MMDSNAAGFGGGMPEGGIMPARTLCTTLSHLSASCSTFAVSTSSRVMAIAAASPAFFDFSLWQTTQYWLMAARSVAAVMAGADVTGVWALASGRNARQGTAREII